MPRVRLISANDVHAKDIMSKKPLTMHKWDRLSAAVGHMANHDMHELPIVDKHDRLVGLLTMDEVMRRGKRDVNATINSAMTSPPVVHEETPLPELANIMLTNGYRAVPVVNKGNRVLGIVTRTDVVKVMRNIKERFVNEKLEDVMKKPIEVVHEHDGIPEVRAMMRRLKVPTIPVIDSLGHVSGVIGEKDISRFMDCDWNSEDAGEYAGNDVRIRSDVWSFMSDPAITLGPNDTVADAIEKMLYFDISSIVVAVNGIPIGMIRKYDIMKLLAGLEKRDMIYVQITGLRAKEQIVYDIVYDIIQKHLHKLGERLEVYGLTMVIHPYGAGKGRKFSVHAQLHTPVGMYTAQTYDWDLFIAIDDLMTNLVERTSRVKHYHEPKHRLTGTPWVKQARAIADSAYDLPNYYLDGTEAST